MGDTSPTKVSMETPLLPLCHREWRERLPPRSTHMQPTGPGFRYWYVHSCLCAAATLLLTSLITCCLCKDPVDWRVCGADARGYTGTWHSWRGTCSFICTFVVVLFIAYIFFLSFYRQSYQRSTTGQKRSWRFLYYQTLFLIILFSEMFNLSLTLTPPHHEIQVPEHTLVTPVLDERLFPSRWCLVLRSNARRLRSAQQPWTLQKSAWMFIMEHHACLTNDPITGLLLITFYLFHWP